MNKKSDFLLIVVLNSYIINENTFQLHLSSNYELYHINKPLNIFAPIDIVTASPIYPAPLYHPLPSASANLSFNKKMQIIKY